MSMPVLQVQGISKRFGGLQALSDVGMTIQAGQVYGLIGPNGAGKTTFFNVITGLYTPDSGSFMLAGAPYQPTAVHEVAQAGIARTFQNIRLFAEMSALENVMVGRHVRTGSGLLGAIFRTAKFKQEEIDIAVRAQELLDYVGIGHLAEFKARTLSYGDQRRLEIARALATDPKLIAERDANPIAFLKTRVYAPALAEGKTVGYKLHVEQIEQKRVLFGYLKANRSLKIIQLTRRNFLAETASRLIAKRTGRWHIEDESQRSTETVEIPFKLLLKNYRHLLSLDEKIRRLTRHHARMELTYEDFVSAPDLWLNKIQEHIGVNPLPLEIRTVKQETRPLNEIITNFEELRRQAKGTPLAFLFQA